MTTTQIIDLIRQGTSPLTRKTLLEIAKRLEGLDGALDITEDHLGTARALVNQQRAALWLVEQENKRLSCALARYRRRPQKFARKMRKEAPHAIA